MAERTVGHRRKAYRRGHRGEWLAALALMLKGYRILARRHRTKLGEIDLIARRGDLVLFVEVKARRTLMEAMEAIAHDVGTAQRGRRRPVAVAPAGLWQAFNTLRHGGGAALALAGACRECFLWKELRGFTLPRGGSASK